MGINRLTLPRYLVYPDPEERSVFISTPRPVDAVVQSWREKLSAWFGRGAEERVLSDEELALWSSDEFHPRGHLPRVREAAAHDAGRRNDYKLCVTVDHRLHANQELDRLLAADMLVIARIETQSSALAERIFRQVQGVRLCNIAHAPMTSAAKACAEVAIAQFQREQRRSGHGHASEAVWRDEDDLWD